MNSTEMLVLGVVSGMKEKDSGYAIQRIAKRADKTLPQPMNYGTLSGALASLARQGLLVKPKRGVYALPRWIDEPFEDDDDEDEYRPKIEDGQLACILTQQMIIIGCEAVHLSKAEASALISQQRNTITALGWEPVDRHEFRLMYGEILGHAIGKQLRARRDNG